MISKDVIETIRERTDIVAVVREHVPTLKQRGRAFTGLCPFHKEKSPSFSVNPEKGFFYCFGCKKGGSVLDFVMEVEGLTFPEAVRSLAERLGIVVEESHESRTDEARRRRERDDLFSVNQLAASFFEAQLRESPSRDYAAAELARRGLRPSWLGGTPGADKDMQARIDDAVQAFRIGYAPAGWDSLARYLKTQGASLSAAEAVGLLVPRNDGSGHFDRFHHRLMFAVVDPQGRVVAFSGRALEPPPDYRRAKPGERIAKYINSPESPIYVKGQTLFGLFQARNTLLQSKDKVAVLVEGNFDVVSLHARGFSNVMAPLGTAVTVDQMKLLRSRATSVVFLFDADEAGKKGVALGREACQKVGLTAKVATLPEGKDPDELVRSPGGVTKLQASLEAAQGALEYMLEQLLDASFVAADARERSDRLQAVAKLLSEEDDPIVRSMTKAYADKLAGRLDLVRTGPEAFRALEESVRRALSRAPAGPAGRAPADTALRHGAGRRPDTALPEPESEDGASRAHRGTAYRSGQSRYPESRSAESRYPESRSPDSFSSPSRFPPRGGPSRSAGVNDIGARGAPDPRRARIAVKAPGSAWRGAIIGALVDFPELLDDPDVEESLSVLEGRAALVVAALAKAFYTDETGKKALDTVRFLSQIPEDAKAFVSARLAEPRHATSSEAKTELLKSAQLLQSLALREETTQAARSIEKLGDDGLAWLRELSNKHRARHGLGPDASPPPTSLEQAVDEALGAHSHDAELLDAEPSDAHSLDSDSLGSDALDTDAFGSDAFGSDALDTDALETRPFETASDPSFE